MSLIFAQQRPASGSAIIFGVMGSAALAGPGRITSGALVWNTGSPHRTAPVECILRSIDGLTTVVAKPGLTTQQDVDGDWVVDFRDAAAVIGQWYRADYRRTDVGTFGAIGSEFVQAKA